MSERQSTEKDATEEWGYDGGDGHGYRYQYIGPIHYLCECGDYFLNRDPWIAHKTVARVEQRLEAESVEAPGYYDDVVRILREEANRVTTSGATDA